jgi:hypothetical protein
LSSWEADDVDTHIFELFEASNFDAYDKDRYVAVLEEAAAGNGIATADVSAVAQDLGLWAVCTTGVFRADLRGVFKKRIEVGEVTPYSLISHAQIEPAGPHTAKVVLRGEGSKRIAQVEFSPAGPGRTVEGPPLIAATSSRRWISRWQAPSLKAHRARPPCRPTSPQGWRATAGTGGTADSSRSSRAPSIR